MHDHLERLEIVHWRGIGGSGENYFRKPGRKIINLEQQRQREELGDNNIVTVMGERLGRHRRELRDRHGQGVRRQTWRLLGIW